MFSPQFSPMWGQKTSAPISLWFCVPAFLLVCHATGRAFRGYCAAVTHLALRPIVSNGLPKCSPADIVVAKSAPLRFRLRRKLRSLPCSSSPHATRFAVGGPLARLGLWRRCRLTAGLARGPKGLAECSDISPAALLSHGFPWFALTLLVPPGRPRPAAGLIMGSTPFVITLRPLATRGVQSQRSALRGSQCLRLGIQPRCSRQLSASIFGTPRRLYVNRPPPVVWKDRKAYTAWLQKGVLFGKPAPIYIHD